MKGKKLKKLLNDKRFWKTEAWLGGILLGIPFFVSGKSFIGYISSLTINNVILAIIGALILGLFMEVYVKKIFK